MNLRLFFIAAYFALLLSQSFAQDTHGQEIKKHAGALLEHARQLSDIRSLNAPPFSQSEGNFFFCRKRSRDRSWKLHGGMGFALPVAPGDRRKRRPSH